MMFNWVHLDNKWQEFGRGVYKVDTQLWVEATVAMRWLADSVTWPWACKNLHLPKCQSIKIIREKIMTRTGAGENAIPLRRENYDTLSTESGRTITFIHRNIVLCLSRTTSELIGVCNISRLLDMGTVWEPYINFQKINNTQISKYIYG